MAIPVHYAMLHYEISENAGRHFVKGRSYTDLYIRTTKEILTIKIGCTLTYICEQKFTRAILTTPTFILLVFVYNDRH